MKLVVCNKNHFIQGGAERYFFAIQGLLASAGHEVMPYSVAFRESLPSPYSEYFPPPPGREGASHFRGFRLTSGEKLRAATAAVYSLSAKRNLVRMIRDHGADLGYILNVVNYMSLSVVDSFWELEVPSVLRFSDFNFSCAKQFHLRDDEVCLDCTRARKWPAIMHRCVHGSLAASVLRVIAMRFTELKGIYERVAHFIAPSRFLRNQAIEFGISSEKITHVPTCVNIQGFEYSDREADYVLYAGRVSPEKGVGTLIESFIRLAPPKTRLRIVGSEDPDYGPELRDRARGHAIDFVGPVDAARLKAEYAGALFTVVPSLWHDNSPNVVVEAMATGKPVIGTRLGGIPDQIGEDGGLLVGPGDTEELGSAMDRLLSDTNWRRMVGRSARARAEREFAPEAHLTRIQSVFHQVMREYRA